MKDHITTIRLTIPKTIKENDFAELAFLYSMRLQRIQGTVFQATGSSVNALHFVWALGSKQIPFNLIKL